MEHARIPARLHAASMTLALESPQRDAGMLTMTATATGAVLRLALALAMASAAAVAHAAPVMEIDTSLETDRGGFFLYVQSGGGDAPSVAFNWASGAAARTGARGLLVNVMQSSSQAWHVMLQVRVPAPDARSAMMMMLAGCRCAGNAVFRVYRKAVAPRTVQTTGMAVRTPKRKQ